MNSLEQSFKSFFRRSVKSTSSRAMRGRPEIPRHGSQVETLDQRTMLSGNIVVTIVGNTLDISGDDEANSAFLGVVDNQLVIRGLDDTTINGSTDDFVLDDRLAIDGNTTISLGAGDDTFLVEGVKFGREVRVNLGEGNDLFGMSTSLVNRSLSVQGGEGDDEFALHATLVRQGFQFRGGEGDDLVSVSESVSRKRTILNTGSGDDGVVMTDSLIRNRGLFMLGAGDDQMLVEDSKTSGQTSFFEGSGTDTVQQGETTDTSITDVIDDPNTGVREKGATFLTDLLDQIDVARDGEPPVVVAITVAPDTNEAVESNGTFVTDDSNFIVTGTTEAGATVAFDSDGDGEFDDGTVVADNAGAFTFTTTLTHTDTNNGENILAFQATTAEGGLGVVELDVHFAIGDVVRFTSNEGTFDVELLNDDAPITVANFLSYLTRYTDTIIHRSPGTFVIQGGSFTMDAQTQQVQAITPDAAIVNEFNADNSNIRGTLSMAQISGQPNSGTSGWFINSVDNTQLDTDLHTVFGRVIGDGIDVVERIDALTDLNLNTETSQTALSTIPVRDNYTAQSTLSGTISVASGSTNVTGTGTTFTNHLTVGDVLVINGVKRVIASIPNDTTLTLANPAISAATDVALVVSNRPGRDQLVVFDTIAELFSTT